MLQTSRLTHADQRITEDVEKFTFSISDLYSHTFKVGTASLGSGSGLLTHGLGWGYYTLGWGY